MLWELPGIARTRASTATPPSGKLKNYGYIAIAAKLIEVNIGAEKNSAVFIGLILVALCGN